MKTIVLECSKPLTGHPNNSSSNIRIIASFIDAGKEQRGSLFLRLKKLVLGELVFLFNPKEGTGGDCYAYQARDIVRGGMT
jgi:hypothetical protein